jgi:pyruvate dehydrogenase E1 component alpha subunit
MVKKQYLQVLHAMDLTKDKMITAYRNHVQPIGMGVDPKRVMAELLGKLPDFKRNGWFMHISQRTPFYGGRDCRRTNPVGAGLALQINILKQAE